ncbi:hypothetical protein CCH79_00015658 [Gambusia affinis]|uniref:Phospholipase B-like n=1 Tax=Gambusia affinis TaxID=33528 RepID=A0A315VGA6_GAMAF|nr:hypothetical protein CCH79_00015658 [Gambusia affinis]
MWGVLRWCSGQRAPRLEAPSPRGGRRGLDSRTQRHLPHVLPPSCQPAVSLIFFIYDEETEHLFVRPAVLCGCIAGWSWKTNEQKATVNWDAAQKSVTLQEGVMARDGGACGFFNDSLLLSGWGVLEIQAGFGGAPQDDEITFYLAGYLEGYLTAGQMFSHYTNMFPQLVKDERVLNPLKNFMSQQDRWAREQAAQRRNSDPLWKHVGLILAQLDGLHAGAAEWAKSRHREVLPGYENLLLGHSSWYSYAATMRIYKHWDFRVSDSRVHTGQMSFSSYPGFLMSLDDFYLLGSGLLMTQTSIGVFNASLLSGLSPHRLLAWQRVRLANGLARSGAEWAQLFSRYNSGTYNSQYLVLDLSRVLLRRSIQAGALTVVEQIPGNVVHSDQTPALRRGYWPSYNVPFHAEIYAQSGYAAMWGRYGEDFSYDLCPRAKILRRDQARVSDLSSLKYIMRYNNYKRDPYSKGHPCKTICCRNDLRPRRPRPGGCYDTKVTDYQMALQLTAEAVNGPTTQGGLPPFSWRSFNLTAHQGLPETYTFPFVIMKPTLRRP